MPTIQSNSPQAITLSAGQTLLLIVTQGGLVRMKRYVGTSNAGTMAEDRPITNSRTFGPYSEDNYFELVKIADLIAYEVRQDGASTGSGAAVTGNPTVGQVLTATAPSGLVATSYQWYRQDNNGIKTNIAGATSSTYTLVSGDAGYIVGCTIAASTTAATQSTVVASSSPSIQPQIDLAVADVQQCLLSLEITPQSAPPASSAPVQTQLNWLLAEVTDLWNSLVLSTPQTSLGSSNLPTTQQIALITADIASIKTSIGLQP